MGQIVSSTGLIAVIIFFLTSGYYSFDQTGTHKIARHLSRNLALTIFSVLLYGTFSAVYRLVFGGFGEWVASLLRPVTIAKMVIFGNFDLLYGGHLWFLPAMVYTYGIMWLVGKYRLWRISYALLPALVFLRIAMETLTGSTSISWHWSGNFFVGALPMMLLGHYFAEMRIADKLSPNKTVIFAITGVFVTYLLVLVQPFGVNFSQVGKVWAACGLFLLAIQRPDLSINQQVEWIGENLSKWVYILHPLVGRILSACLNPLLNNSCEENMLFPFAVAMATIVISMFIKRFTRARDTRK